MYAVHQCYTKKIFFKKKKLKKNKKWCNILKKVAESLDTVEFQVYDLGVRMLQ